MWPMLFVFEQPCQFCRCSKPGFVTTCLDGDNDEHDTANAMIDTDTGSAVQHMSKKDESVKTDKEDVAGSDFEFSVFIQ